MFLLLEEDLEFLSQMGLSNSQLKMYFALLKLEKADVKTLAKKADLPRQAAYRTLDELQAKGIVEKIIESPVKYAAIQLPDLLSNMISLKTNEYTQTLRRTEELLKKCAPKNQQIEPEINFKISMIDGKENIISKFRSSHANAKSSVYCCSTFHRWIYVASEIHETIQKALARGVKYRIIVDDPLEQIKLPEEIKFLLRHKDFQVKKVCSQLKINGVIFDENITAFSLFPSKAIRETPVIWTNHPSISISFKDHFDKNWKKATRIL